MTRRTRLFLGVAVGILVLGLGTGLVASYLGLQPSYLGLQNLLLIGSDGPAELADLPADTRLVAFANVREIMDSDFRRKFRDLPGVGRSNPPAVPPDVPSDPPPDWRTQTGLDIERDIDSVMASASGVGGDAERQQPLLLARGRFDQTRIEAFIREHGGTVQDYRGRRLFEFTNPVQGGPSQNGSVAVSFVEPNLAAVGSPASVRRAIDTKAAGQEDATDNADLMRFLKDVQTGNTWAVARFDALDASGQLPAVVRDCLPAISWLSATGHVNGGVRGTLTAEARDEAGGQDLREVIQGLVALARMQSGQGAVSGAAPSGLSAVLDSFDLSGSGKTVSMRFNFPLEMIDGLASLASRARRGGPPGPPASLPEPAAP